MYARCPHVLPCETEVSTCSFWNLRFWDFCESYLLLVGGGILFSNPSRLPCMSLGTSFSFLNPTSFALLVHAGANRGSMLRHLPQLPFSELRDRTVRVYFMGAKLNCLCSNTHGVVFRCYDRPHFPTSWVSFRVPLQAWGWRCRWLLPIPPSH
jgi:hypothetical protein